MTTLAGGAAAPASAMETAEIRVENDPSSPTAGIQDAVDRAHSSAGPTIPMALPPLPPPSTSSPQVLRPTVFLPDGEYLISRTIQIPRGVRLVLDPGAVIRARTGTPFSGSEMLRWWVAGQAQHDVHQDQELIRGGTIDCAAVVDIGIRVARFVRIRISGIEVHNANSISISLGDQPAEGDGKSYEASLTDIRIWRDPSSQPRPGSIGILIDHATDSVVQNAIVNGARTGVQINGQFCDIVAVHVWNHCPDAAAAPDWLPVVCFDDVGGVNRYTNCYADTPTTSGWKIHRAFSSLVNCIAYGGDNLPDLTAYAVRVVPDAHADSTSLTSVGLTVVASEQAGQWLGDFGGDVRAVIALASQVSKSASTLARDAQMASVRRTEAGTTWPVVASYSDDTIIVSGMASDGWVVLPHPVEQRPGRRYTIVLDGDMSGRKVSISSVGDAQVVGGSLLDTPYQSVTYIADDTNRWYRVG